MGSSPDDRIRVGTEQFCLKEALTVSHLSILCRLCSERTTVCISLMIPLHPIAAEGLPRTLSTLCRVDVLNESGKKKKKHRDAEQQSAVHPQTHQRQNALA